MEDINNNNTNTCWIVSKSKNNKQYTMAFKKQFFNYFIHKSTEYGMGCCLASVTATGVDYDIEVFINLNDMLVQFVYKYPPLTSKSLLFLSINCRNKLIFTDIKLIMFFVFVYVLRIGI